MILQCSDLDRALRTPELMPDMRAHAENCLACAEALHWWNEISRVAPEFRQEWESPFLWRRIEANLSAEPSRRRRVWRGWTIAAAAVVILGVTMLLVVRRPGTTLDRELLTEQALSDVEKAEAAYAGSIAKLAAVAAKDLEQSTSPLASAYREKLALLDDAIAEAKTNVERNRFNTYLRTELASLYQEKQKTLQEWVRNANRN